MQSLSGRDDDCLTFDPWKDGMDGQVAARGARIQGKNLEEKEEGLPMGALRGAGGERFSR